ncbi:hypothetical protein [Phosphitispora fastidiosa]|uniref:hypothetical protein n=1 Tax=Phosphitispora fastidiosa TaxID=2837202 RepID=UPI001E54C4DC|nr:hypothetical protein [Phosphitispora fastidiosa]MBU7006291.1 ABC-type Co2+ transport system permease subunit [Phosphitispora fastidiosa]
MIPFLIAIILGWFVFGKNIEKEQRFTPTIAIAFISLFVFKLLSRTVVGSGGTSTDALLAGSMFGAIAILVCWGARWLFLYGKRNASQ